MVADVLQLILLRNVFAHFTLKENIVKASNVLKLQVFSLIHKAADIFIIATGILPTERIALETCTSTGKSKCVIGNTEPTAILENKQGNRISIIPNNFPCSMRI
ncbi:Hypothetical predicted protein [Octopus vulgaris]|uniref:Uncharacterized protein n=1 Tax=Octopus vulgaris TaxID=6645 RepID=A0AA36F823_OCTVU|nr:Hypothetical predicted protein [Octopus vulgaris]